MFIARSAAKIRLVRLAFLLVCLIPCGLLIGWAIERRSERHRGRVIADVGRAIGASVVVDDVEHPRPGVIRLRGCVVTAGDGRRMIALPDVEIEDAGAEVRLRIGRLICDAHAARWLSRLSWEWLEQEPRFPRTCIVDIAEVVWDGAMERSDEGSAAAATTHLRIECVVRGGVRAIRCVRQSGGGAAADDLVKVVRTSSTAEAAGATPQIEVDVAWQQPVPLGIAAALLGSDELRLGEAATIVGRLHAQRVAGEWIGDAQARVSDIDLAACGAAVGVQASGPASVEIGRATWSGERLRECDLVCLAGPGRVEQRWLDAASATIGCRPGPAFRSLQGDAQRAFDAAGCVVRVGDHGCSVESPARLAGSLMTAAGLSVIDPPAAAVPADRLAWLLAAPRAVQVPSTGPGAWLMSRLPGAAAPAAAPGPAPGGPPAAIQAGQPGQRGGI
jgi:hypothetical protein